MPSPQALQVIKEQHKQLTGNRTNLVACIEQPQAWMTPNTHYKGDYSGTAACYDEDIFLSMYRLDKYSQWGLYSGRKRYLLYATGTGYLKKIFAQSYVDMLLLERLWIRLNRVQYSTLYLYGTPNNYLKYVVYALYVDIVNEVPLYLAETVQYGERDTWDCLYNEPYYVNTTIT
jgi:hypothetical protein